MIGRFGVQRYNIQKRFNENPAVLILSGIPGEKLLNAKPQMKKSNTSYLNKMT